MTDQFRGRVLLAKVGMDGHDRGIKVVARLLRDAGFEVVYLGLRNTPEMIAAAALDEDVDCVGLSMHNGAHMTLGPAVVKALAGRGLDTPVVIGGIVPGTDLDELAAHGVTEILGPGASADEVAETVDRAIARRHSK